MDRTRNDPYWLHPNDPRYWEHQQQRLQEMHARLEEQSKPKSITFELTWDDSLIVEEALRRANTYCGTNDITRALLHICQEYLIHGPHVRHMNSMAAKHKAQTDSHQMLLQLIANPPPGQSPTMADSQSDRGSSRSSQRKNRASSTKTKPLQMPFSMSDSVRILGVCQSHAQTLVFLGVEPPKTARKTDIMTKIRTGVPCVC